MKIHRWLLAVLIGFSAASPAFAYGSLGSSTNPIYFAQDPLQRLADQEAALKSQYGSGSYGSCNGGTYADTSDPHTRSMYLSLTRSCLEARALAPRRPAYVPPSGQVITRDQIGGKLPAEWLAPPAPQLTNDHLCKRDYGAGSYWNGTVTDGKVMCACSAGYEYNATSAQCVESARMPVPAAETDPVKKYNDDVCSAKWGTDVEWNGGADANAQPTCQCKFGAWDAVAYRCPAPGQVQAPVAPPKQIVLQKMPANPRGMVISDSLGKTWWVDPADGKKYPLHSETDMSGLTYKKALGISNKDVATLTGSTKDSKAMFTRLRGKVLLTVEEAYWRLLWVEPVSGKVVDLGRLDLSKNLAGMREHAIGLAGGDLAKFTLGSY